MVMQVSPGRQAGPDSACIAGLIWHMLCHRRGETAPRQAMSRTGREEMSIQDEAPASAPNAILERMRRRIGRVGMLVAFVSVVLTVSVIFFVCACASLHL